MQQTPTRRVEGELPSRHPAGYAGYAVHDPLGRKIGVAQEVFVNDDGETEYVKTSLAPFGLRTVLLPVQMVATDEKRRTIELR